MLPLAEEQDRRGEQGEPLAGQGGRLQAGAPGPGAGALVRFLSRNQETRLEIAYFFQVMYLFLNMLLKHLL